MLWFNKEAFERLGGWLVLLTTVVATADPDRPAAEAAKEILAAYDLSRRLAEAGEASGYQVERLLDLVSSPA